MCVYMKNVTMLLLVCFILGTTATCKNSPIDGNSPPVINGIGWLTGNMDTSYWTKWGYTDPPTAWRNFSIYAADPDGRQDIYEIDVIDPDNKAWYVENHYSAGEGCWGGWWHHYYDGDYPDSVMLGEYTVVVRDTAGHETAVVFYITTPGGSGTSGFIYNSDYSGSTVGGTLMLERAAVTAVSKGTDSIDISFTVNDPRVFNGMAWLYHDNGSDIVWIGASPMFRDAVNGGGGLYTDGTTNSLVIAQSELDMGSYSYSDIDGFHLLLTDGEQYLPEEEWFDHYSVAEYKGF